MLIIGVGKGTKQLQGFLECTKSYEAITLFGVATDTYDVLGKVLSKAPYSHITRAGVEKALQTFRGKIMQVPPIYSALRVQGKRLYEYAREGKEVPVEIQARPVEVKEMGIADFLSPGSHNYKLPTEEAPTDEKEVAQKVLHIENIDGPTTAKIEEIDEKGSGAASSGTKRKRLDDEDDVFVSETGSSSKCQEEDPEHCISRGLPPPDNTKIATSGVATPSSSSNLPNRDPSSESDLGPPAVKLRMTVTSGFYVRSLSHDLGPGVDSLGVMSELVRTRQGEFELGKNVLEYEDLGKGEEVWGPKVERMLDQWNERNSRGKSSISPDEDETMGGNGSGKGAADGEVHDGKGENMGVDDVKPEGLKHEKMVEEHLF